MQLSIRCYALGDTRQMHTFSFGHAFDLAVPSPLSRQKSYFPCEGSQKKTASRHGANYERCDGGKRSRDRSKHDMEFTRSSSPIRQRGGPLKDEFLHAVALGFTSYEVALGIDAETVKMEELAGLAPWSPDVTDLLE